MSKKEKNTNKFCLEILLAVLVTGTMIFKIWGLEIGEILSKQLGFWGGFIFMLIIPIILIWIVIRINVILLVTVLGGLFEALAEAERK